MLMICVSVLGSWTTCSPIGCLGKEDVEASACLKRDNIDGDDMIMMVMTMMTTAMMMIMMRCDEGDDDADEWSFEKGGAV
jgi:hypothetical protein